MPYTVATNSLGHTIGNITSCITEYTKSLFPYNFFKTVHISSTIAYKQLKQFDYSNKEFIKKLRPMLIIRPRVDLTDTDVFLGNTYLSMRILDNMLGDVDFNNLQPFVADKQKNVYINYLMNRIKVYFDVTVISETQMEQINIANGFRNIVRQDRPFMIDTYLESHIPKHFIYAFARDVEIPVYKEDGNIKDFLEYINNHSAFPVTYKFKNSTGNDEFFRFYPVSLDTVITNMSVDDGTKRGFVSDIYTTNFTIGCEFSTSGLYYYFTENKQIIEQVQGDLKVINNNGSTMMFPLFTSCKYYDDVLPNGWKLYTSTIYKVEKNNTPDILDFSPILNSSLKKFITYHLSKGIPITTFMDIRVHKDNRLLEISKNHYSVNMEKLELTTNVCNVYSSYRLLIYVNILYMNEMSNSIYELSDEK